MESRVTTLLQPPSARSVQDREGSDADDQIRRQQPQRHQRKHTDQRKISVGASALSDFEELPVGDAVEEEMPPKMKRRLNLAHGLHPKKTTALGKRSRTSSENKEEVVASPVNRPRSRMSISELTDGGGDRPFPSNVDRGPADQGITEAHSRYFRLSITLSPPSTSQNTLPTSPLLSRHHNPTVAPPELSTGSVRSAPMALTPQNDPVTSPIPSTDIGCVRAIRSLRQTMRSFYGLPRRSKLISSLSSEPSLIPSSSMPDTTQSDLTSHDGLGEEVERDGKEPVGKDMGIDNPEDGEIRDGNLDKESGQDRTINHHALSPVSRAPSQPPSILSTTLPPSLPAKPSPSYNGLPPKTTTTTATSMKSSPVLASKLYPRYLIFDSF
ncbi:hypothetical protein D9757_015062 [Collybiopsis confluens]|uniref:Uncharacterized protein n=1 Tax=Collybiopsis confluens TaxID=2823264 RepID=A0A8H5FQ43_9AGAR|nr:hypothetical protein D9757_015062 [Collybiopsis confluens]